MLVTGPPVLLVDLHGKLDPSAARGLLSGVPYGGGWARSMWASAAQARRAIAEAERAALMEGIFLFWSFWLVLVVFVCLLCEWDVCGVF